MEQFAVVRLEQPRLVMGSFSKAVVKRLLAFVMDRFGIAVVTWLLDVLVSSARWFMDTKQFSMEMSLGPIC